MLTPTKDIYFYRVILLLSYVLFLSSGILAQSSNSEFQSTPVIILEPQADFNVVGHQIGGDSKFLPPGNDDCLSATTLLLGGSESCINTDDATVQAGEGVCRGLLGGAAWETVWYKFQANANSTTISLNRTGDPTSCGTDLVIFGGFASSAAADAACLPGVADFIDCQTVFSSLDPGYAYNLTTVPNEWYLFSIQNQSCGGPGDRDYEGCVKIFNAPINNLSSGAELIDECGVEINGTNIGYSPTNIIPGFEDLDANVGTTCPSCITAGDDVPYVVNNDSWFYFCATGAGFWSVTFDGISDCYFTGLTPSPGLGLQMSIFIGDPTNLTVVQHAPSPSVEGSTWTSSTFFVAAGECVYLLVDGFAGDQCDYTYTLNNVSGGCNLFLPIELLSFNGHIENDAILLDWVTGSEINNDFFTVEKSRDGVDYDAIGTVNGSGNSSSNISYSFNDNSPFQGENYYRLSQTDFDGTTEVFSPVEVYFNIGEFDINILSISNGNYLLNLHSQNESQSEMSIFDMLGNEVYSSSLQLQVGSNTQALDLSFLNQGLYSLRVTSKTHQEFISFLK